MRPKVDVITLAVADLDRALAFYRAVGLESRGIVGTEYPGDDVDAAGAIAPFQLRDGVILSLYPRSELAKDAGIPRGAPASGEFSLGQFAGSREDVDAVLAQAAAAGGEVLGEARERPWGIYSGYFRDPDGHLWEIIWSPQTAAPAG